MSELARLIKAKKPIPGLHVQKAGSRVVLTAKTPSGISRVTVPKDEFFAYLEKRK